MTPPSQANAASHWIGWLLFSASLHALVALALLTAHQRPEIIAVRPSPQQHEMRVAFFAAPLPQPVAETTPTPPLPLEEPLLLASSAEPHPEQPLVKEHKDSVKPENEPERKLDETVAKEPAPAKPSPSPEPPPLPREAPAEPEQPMEPQLPESAPRASATQQAQTPEPPAPAAPARKMEGGALREQGPSALINPAPRYPRVAIARGLTGRVWLEVTLCARGLPHDCRVLKSSGHSVLDRQARHTVLKEWRFQEGRAAGRSATVAIDFRLRGG